MDEMKKLKLVRDVLQKELGELTYNLEKKQLALDDMIRHKADVEEKVTSLTESIRDMDRMINRDNMKNKAIENQNNINIAKEARTKPSGAFVKISRYKIYQEMIDFVVEQIKGKWVSKTAVKKALFEKYDYSEKTVKTYSSLIFQYLSAKKSFKRTKNNVMIEMLKPETTPSILEEMDTRNKRDRDSMNKRC